MGCRDFGYEGDNSFAVRVAAEQSVRDLREFLLAREVEAAAERNVAPDGPWLREGTPYKLRQYAQRYADHPDYRQEWKP